MEAEIEMPGVEIETGVRDKEESKAAQDYKIYHEDQMVLVSTFVCL